MSAFWACIQVLAVASGASDSAIRWTGLDWHCHGGVGQEGSTLVPTSESTSSFELSSVNMVTVGFLLLISLRLSPLVMPQLALANIILFQPVASLGFQAVLQYLALVRAFLALGYAALFFQVGCQCRDS